MFAAIGGQDEIVESMLTKYWCDESAIDQNDHLAKYTSLSYASKYGRTRIAALLLEYGANVNGRTTRKLMPYYGAPIGYMTPLMLASQAGNEETVAVLLLHNASVNLQASDGSSALSPAVKSRRP